MLKNTTIKTPNEFDVKQLLQECGLPASDITPKHLEHFFGFYDNSGLLGVVGLEIFGTIALLRSLAVLSKHRKNGIGRHLVAHAEQYAHAQCVQVIYLLTATADQFFSKLGYSPTPRSQAPSAIQETAEFSNLCPSSSILMVKHPVRQLSIS